MTAKLNVQDLLTHLPIDASRTEVKELARKTVDATMLDAGDIAGMADDAGVQFIPRDENGEISWERFMQCLKSRTLVFARHRQDAIDDLVEELEAALLAREKELSRIGKTAVSIIYEAEEDGIVMDVETAILRAHYSLHDLDAIRGFVEGMLE